MLKFNNTGLREYIREQLRLQVAGRRQGQSPSPPQVAQVLRALDVLARRLPRSLNQLHARNAVLALTGGRQGEALLEVGLIKLS